MDWPHVAKCAFGDQKGLIRNKDMTFGNPLIMGQKMRTFKIINLFLPIMGQKVVFWVKKGVFGCVGLSVR